MLKFGTAAYQFPPAFPIKRSSIRRTRIKENEDDAMTETAQNIEQELVSLGPCERGNQEVLSFNDFAEQRKIETNTEIQHWLKAHDDDDDSDSSDCHDYFDSDLETYRNAETQSPPLGIKNLAEQSEESGHFPPWKDDVASEEQEPLPGSFYRPAPWQDPVKASGVDNTKDQPSTSNAAAYRWNQESALWETASCAASWGSRRRLSESDLNPTFDDTAVQHRNNKDIKEHVRIPTSDSAQDAEMISHTHTNRESLSASNDLQRIVSFGKSRSPPLTTAGASIAMAGKSTAVDHGSSMNTEFEVSTSALKMLKKLRSKSDIGMRIKSSPGLAELMTIHGGPPMPTLTPPMQEPITSSSLPNASTDEEQDDAIDEARADLDLEVPPDLILPTLEGFKTHARLLNPLLEPYLIDRIGHEQVQRYKKLVENKIRHMQAVHVQRKCSSGKYCFDLGGDATLLALRASARDPEQAHGQFQVDTMDDAKLDESGLAGWVLFPALFPRGIPLPPVKLLPAEFECPLCFKVKKFQRPSDWTRHVHEDVEPFSCTFANCSDPKSFKRQVDWMRHENERHRHQEFWKCQFPECSHICYRKDNFVLHLVREHRMVEPKVKSRESASSKAKGGYDSAESELWQLVDSCRHETINKPQDQPCRFCGSVYSTWKKLNLHMAKHMEQLAMPVLELVRMREVSPDKVISPIEQLYPTSGAVFSGGIPASRMLDASSSLPKAMSMNPTMPNLENLPVPNNLEHPDNKITPCATEDSYSTQGSLLNEDTLPGFVSIKNTTVELLLHVLFQRITACQKGNAEEGANSQCQNSRKRSRNESGGQKKRRKRTTRNSNFNGDEDEDDELLNDANLIDAPQDAARLFACPFYKYDSRLFGSDAPDKWYRLCGVFHTMTIANLKVHFERRHYLPEYMCYICCEVFQSEAALMTHQRPLPGTPICTRRDPPLFQERIHPYLKDRLGLKEKNKPNFDEEKCWFHYYDGLFPGSRALRPVTPWFQYPAAANITLYQDFRRLHLPSLIPLVRERLGFAGLLDEDQTMVLMEAVDHEASNLYLERRMQSVLPILGLPIASVDPGPVGPEDHPHANPQSTATNSQNDENETASAREADISTAQSEDEARILDFSLGSSYYSNVDWEAEFEALEKRSENFLFAHTISPSTTYT